MSRLCMTLSKMLNMNYYQLSRVSCVSKWLATQSLLKPQSAITDLAELAKNHLSELELRWRTFERRPYTQWHMQAKSSQSPSMNPGFATAVEAVHAFLVGEPRQEHWGCTYELKTPSAKIEQHSCLIGLVDGQVEIVEYGK